MTFKTIDAKQYKIYYMYSKLLHKHLVQKPRHTTNTVTLLWSIHIEQHWD